MSGMIMQNPYQAIILRKPFELKINREKIGKSQLKAYILISVSYDELKKEQKKTTRCSIRNSRN